MRLRESALNLGTHEHDSSLTLRIPCRKGPHQIGSSGHRGFWLKLPGYLITSASMDEGKTTGNGDLRPSPHHVDAQAGCPTCPACPRPEGQEET